MKVFIKNNKVFTEEQVRKALKLALPGKVFSSEAMQEDISNIQAISKSKILHRAVWISPSQPGLSQINVRNYANNKLSLFYPLIKNCK